MFQKIFLKDTDIHVVDAEVTNVFIDMNTEKVVPVENEIISLWPDLGKYFKKTDHYSVNPNNAKITSLKCGSYFRSG